MITPMINDQLIINPTQVQPGQIAVVTVASGIGIARVFASFGAAAIIVFGGFVNAIYWGVRESTIRSQVVSARSNTSALIRIRLRSSKPG